MSGHTPGPWTSEPASMGFGGLYGPDGKIIFALAYARADERPEAECKANEALIKASPDLLIALKALREAVMTVPEMNNHKFDGLGVQVNKAIAKAEGRS